MALKVLDSADTQEELESDATVATETTLNPIASDFAANTLAHASESDSEPTTTELTSQETTEATETVETPADLPEQSGDRGRAEVAEDSESITEPRLDPLVVATRDPASEPIAVAATLTAANFDDEFLVVASPATDIDASTPSSIASADYANDPQAAETAPLDGVAVPDPKIGEINKLLESCSATVSKLVEHLRKVRELETQIANSCELELELRDRLKTVRKNREGLVERLTKLKAGDNESEVDDDENEAYDDDRGDDESRHSVTSVPCSPQAWGSDPVEVLEKFGLKAKKVEALRAAADAGRFNGTVRGLRDWIAKSDLWHRDVKGCGPTGADKIGDALTAYMKANPIADEPMTKEDEARSEAAAIALGHKKPAEPVSNSEPAYRDCDGNELKPGDTVQCVTCAGSDFVAGVEYRVEDIKDSWLLIDGNRWCPSRFRRVEKLPESEPPSTPQEREPEPSKPKRTRKPRAKKETGEPNPFRESNAGQLDRVDAIMSGEPDPAGSIANTEQAKEAGRAAGASELSCSANPFPRDHEFGKAWHEGWEETAK